MLQVEAQLLDFQVVLQGQEMLLALQAEHLAADIVDRLVVQSYLALPVELQLVVDTVNMLAVQTHLA